MASLICLCYMLLWMSKFSWTKLSRMVADTWKPQTLNPTKIKAHTVYICLLSLCRALAQVFHCITVYNQPPPSLHRQHYCVLSHREAKAIDLRGLWYRAVSQLNMYTKVVIVVEHVLYRQHDMEIIFTKNHKRNRCRHERWPSSFTHVEIRLLLSFLYTVQTDSIIIQFHKQTSKRD